MSILERRTPRPPAGEQSPSGERLRVVTAGHVGNMDARLGVSGFDVIAVAETEEELLVAVSGDDPDAIVVEADLCDSLEHVRELAPDAVVIVVGDHTPAGAIGRIERGVTGTVMAGLLHALVAEGLGAAVVWGLVPAVHPPAAPATQHLGGTLLSAKAHALGTQIADLLRDHVATVAAAGAVAAALSAGVVVSLHGPRVHERTEAVTTPPPVVSTAEPQHPVVVSSPAPQVPAHDGGPTKAQRTADGAPAAHPPTVATPPVAPPSPTPAPAPSPVASQTPPPPSPAPQPSQTPPPSPTPPPPDQPSQTPPPDTPAPPPTAEGTRPPGVANGWDDNKPPKHDDNGNHNGWTNNGSPHDDDDSD
jgi:hypothetical protein